MGENGAGDDWRTSLCVKWLGEGLAREKRACEGRLLRGPGLHRAGPPDTIMPEVRSWFSSSEAALD